MSKKKSKLQRCYWCDKELTKKEATKDHLFSQYLRANFGKNTFCVRACKECNGTRGCISGLFERVHRIKTGTWDEWQTKADKTITPKIVQKLLSRVDVLKFRSKIEGIKCGHHKHVCLMEIDMIIAFAKES